MEPAVMQLTLGLTAHDDVVVAEPQQ